MADSDSFNKPRLLVPELISPVQPNPSKSYKHFLCKSLLVTFVLVLLPLFPSQAPEFINQTILTKLWELLHLLFIGIAVSYGLFGRRNVEMNIETHSKIDNSQTNLSGILHVPSIFEDGFENPCVSDEKKVTQTWNSHYFQGESMVAVAQENCVLDEWGKPRPSIDYKPLGLPIRSLRSRNVDTDTPDSMNRSGSSSSLRGSSKSSDKIRNGKIRGMVPINLDKKFKETVVLSSPIPWRSRSGRMELREEMGTVKHRSHSRPLSVGEFELEHLKSQSSRSSISSQVSSISSSPKKVSPSSTIYSEVPNSNMEDLERDKSLYGSSEPALHSPLAPTNGEASFIASKARRFSIGSSSEMNVRRSFEDNLKDLSKSRREDPPFGRGKWGVDSLNSDVKPTASVKDLRGRSVRTIRTSEHVVEARETGEIFANHIEDKVGKTHDKFEAVLMEYTGRMAGLENLPIATRKQNLDNLCPLPNSAFFKYQNEEKPVFADSYGVESEKDSESEFENFQVSSDEEEADSYIVDDEELDHEEVDRKAGEFIAKFREQIRLQKIASIEGASGW